ncbi:MAG: hypothetical protein ACOY0T_32025 [Myxococcota bacterium]
MRRKFWAVLLGIGAIAGFAAGFRSLHHMGYSPCGCGWGPGARRANFEAHVADVCTEAAERVHRNREATH